ncbi:MAG: hypothetical protein ACO1SV_03965 [Fimbriimonas sp.]
MKRSERWDRWLGRRLDWTVASALLTLTALLVWAQLRSNYSAFDLVPTLIMASLPIACLLRRQPTVGSMLALMVVGCPCFCSATAYCDMSSNQVTGVLHQVEGYLIFLPLYGLLRAIHLGVTKP